MHAISSPFIIPLAAFLIPIVAIISDAINRAHARRVAADQRILMLQRGMPVAEIERLVGTKGEAEQGESRGPVDPVRSMANARRAATVLISCGIGIAICCALLAFVLERRAILAGAAGAVVPLAIGIGFWIDYRLQAREVERLGLGMPEMAMREGRLP
jgi:hypothetical protein